MAWEIKPHKITYWCSLFMEADGRHRDSDPALSAAEGMGLRRLFLRAHGSRGFAHFEWRPPSCRCPSAGVSGARHGLMGTSPAQPQAHLLVVAGEEAHCTPTNVDGQRDL